MSSDVETFLQQLETAFASRSVQKAVLSKPASKANDAVRRIDVRPVTIREQLLYQFTSREGNQERHRNLTADEAVNEIRESAGTAFRDCLLRTDSAEWTARFNKKGRCLVTERSVQTETPVAPAEHNRQRQYLIPEDQVVPFLVATGVMSKSGRVHAKHYSKFRQINRYVEFIRDIVSRLPTEDTLRIVDFGSGKSYLTFAVHYYLTAGLGRKVHITGLDRRADVVQTCQAIASELKLTGIAFEATDIADFQPDEDVHLAISLHACDTATDDALAAAVAWNANVILAVPCCHHELAAALPATAHPVISGHGILHERFCELTTDAVRAHLLECVGYNTTVMEFIEMEHTGRNVLIRAIRRPADSAPDAPRQNWERLQTLSKELSLPPLQLQRNLAKTGALRFDETVS